MVSGTASTNDRTYLLRITAVMMTMEHVVPASPMLLDLILAVDPLLQHSYNSRVSLVASSLLSTTVFTHVHSMLRTGRLPGIL